MDTKTKLLAQDDGPSPSPHQPGHMEGVDFDLSADLPACASRTMSWDAKVAKCSQTRETQVLAGEFIGKVPHKPRKHYLGMFGWRRLPPG